MNRTAAALIVGNEILTGKIEDRNTPYLGAALFRLGISLRRAVICPDEIDEVAGELNRLRASHDLVFTSGGVGPTHDDVTIEAVAHAFGVPIERSAELAHLLTQHFGDRTTEAHLRMANVPRGATLMRSQKLLWPTFRMDNVFVLPGVPELFQKKVDGLIVHLDRGARFHSVAVYTHCDEGSVAELLTALTEEYPTVTIGSYPRFDQPDYRLKLTFDGADRDAVLRAAEALVARLSPRDLVRREP